MNVGQLKQKLAVAGIGREGQTGEDEGRLFVLWGNLRRLDKVMNGPVIDSIRSIRTDGGSSSDDARFALEADSYGMGTQRVQDLLQKMTSLGGEAKIVVEYESGSGDYGTCSAGVEGVLVDDAGNLYLHPRDCDERSNTYDQDANTWSYRLNGSNALHIL